VLRISLVVVIALAFTPSVSQATKLYKWVDENGVTHFSDEQPETGAQRVTPSGMSVIPMRENIRTQRNVENINRSTSTQRQSNTSSSANREKEREKARVQKQCSWYEQRIKWIDNRLRAGGYSVSEGNRLRAERRELSRKRSWECLRGN
jgi:hypothetical protein